MAKNTAKVTVNVINNAQSTSTPPLGIMFVAGATEKGIINDPKDIITSWSQFNRLYGDLLDTDDFPLHCKQALQTGAQLRVSKAAGAAAAQATTSVTGFFTLTSKGSGIYYNTNLKIDITDNTTNFDLLVYDTSSGQQELYEGLVADANNEYMQEVINGSLLVDVSYLSYTTGQPGTSAAQAFTGGADATPLVTDYTSALNAFDNYDDSFIVSVPGQDETSLATLYTVGKAYAEKRKDVVYLQHLDNDNKTQAQIVAELGGFTSSKFACVIGGGVTIPNPYPGGTNPVYDMHSTGTLLGTIARAHVTYGPWYSPSGYIRGVLEGTSGVVNNFGSPAATADRNIIANAGGSMAVVKSQTVMQWDMYTMDLGNSPEKFFSIIMLELFMVDTLTPALEFFLGAPNTFGTWKQIYNTVSPFLESLLDANAVYSYKWSGDQNATSLEELQINDPTEVGQGIYRVQLQIKAVVPIVDIILNIVLTENSVEFE